MKGKVICYCLCLVTTILELNCSRDVDNLTTPPKISITNAQAILPGSSNAVAIDSNLKVVYGSQVTLPIVVHADGGLEQVDYKVIGSSDYQALDINNKKLVAQSVPYDWQGLQSVRAGFQTPNDFKFSILIPHDTAIVYLTIQVFDKNKLKGVETVTITPFQVLPEFSNIVLFSQNSTEADAGGKTQRKFYLSSTTGLTYDSLSAIANASTIDISYADSSGMPILVSPNYRFTATDSSAKISNLSKSLSSLFAEVKVDYSQIIMPGQIETKMDSWNPYVKIKEGKAYAFKNSLGVIGVIKINNINKGIVSSSPNTSVDFTYKVFIPISPQ